MAKPFDKIPAAIAGNRLRQKTFEHGAEMNDITIRNVNILDGHGGAAFVGDVGIEGGRITEVGEAGAGLEEIDGAGQTLAPGLIDTHSHDDGAFFRHPGMEFKLAQGVTTVVAGNCGFSAIPIDDSMDPGRASGGILAGLPASFSDLDGYFAAAMEQQPGINNMMLVGHNTVRTLVMGMEKRAPTESELAQMRDHVHRALEQGACGFSTGLIYRPGRWSATPEVIELARAAESFDALYTTHMRNEGDHLLDAVDEALTIGRESNVHLHISHHKSAGPANWGKVGESLEKVDNAIRAGQRVTLDVYPYTAGSGRMIEYFDLNNINRELAEVIRIASCPAFREYEGKMLKDIAESEARDLIELTHTILTAPKGDRTICIQFIIDEKDVATNLAHKDMMVGSDGIPDLKGKPHPRLFGTFPRILAKYVRDEGILSLPEAIRRMTSLPAGVFGMTDRGQVKPGCWADLMMFNPDTVQDLATYDDPKIEPAGISLVVVNGKIGLQNGEHQMAGSGKMLRYRRNAYKE
ncbi:MAG: N-acyl-D-aspartate/D-glutamate deacylase [Candidatus Azotimanducaceae bacterium]